MPKKRSQVETSVIISRKKAADEQRRESRGCGLRFPHSAVHLNPDVLPIMMCLGETHECHRPPEVTPRNAHPGIYSRQMLLDQKGNETCG